MDLLIEEFVHLAKEKQQIREEGREEGELTARRMLEQILQRRLGAMPAAVSALLHHCTLTELNELVNPALDAATWDDFRARLPERAV